MKTVKQGYTYLLNNFVKGRQKVTFHKESTPDDRGQQGTTLEEVFKMCVDKIVYIDLTKHKNYDKLTQENYESLMRIKAEMINLIKSKEFNV